MSAPPAPRRIGLVGARRVRQGLGPFVARELVAAGWAVPAVLATSAETARAVRADLRAAAGIEPRAHTELAALLAEGLDALAVLSPVGTHGAYLAAALEAGLHVLCEKPLLTEGPDPPAAVRRLAAGCAERGLVLLENCQWPETLPAFRALHPDLPAGPPRRFTMRLTPASGGREMLLDALSHPLSLLQALAPAREVRLENVRFSTREPAAEALRLDLVWRADGHPITVGIDLARGARQPREAAYAVDGREARRLVRTADYRLFLAAGAALVDLPDPLGRRVARFTNLVERASTPAARVVDPGSPPDRSAGAAGSAGQAGSPADGAREPRPDPGEPSREGALRAIVQRTELLCELLAAFEGGPA